MHVRIKDFKIKKIKKLYAKKINKKIKFNIQKTKKKYCQIYWHVAHNIIFKFFNNLEESESCFLSHL